MGPQTRASKKTSQRPALSSDITLTDLADWYWLKVELLALCRMLGLRTSGSKLQVERRLHGHLSGVAVISTVNRRPAGVMPAVFTLETPIGQHWRCNPRLGNFFKKHCGPGFRFNATMRNFIHTESGRTLQDACVCYAASLQLKAEGSLPIEPQLQYNQHVRDFFVANPSATRQEAIDAWWSKRSTRGGTGRRFGGRSDRQSEHGSPV